MGSVPKMSKGTHTLFVRNDGKGPVCERDRCKERQTLVYMYCGHLVS
jgi:ribosomal protein L24E